MEVKNYIKIVDDFIPISALSSLIKWINTQPNKFEKAKIVLPDNESVVNEDVRKVDDFSLEINSKSKTEIHWHNFIAKSFMDLCINYQKYFKIDSSLTGLENITILRYQNNGHYGLHTDHCKSHPRTLSIIFLLNNEYQGGELIFNSPDRKNEILKVEKKPNRAIIWPSNFLYPHKVAPVTKGLRYSIVSWAL